MRDREETVLKGIIFDIQRNSFVDGPGIRTTVFFKGCNLRCAWCHNPESQRFEKEIMFFANKCTGCCRCKDLSIDDEDFICFSNAKEICGKELSVEKIMAEVRKDKSFYEASNGGVTFSGGECMLQADFLEALLVACKAEGIHTAVDTAGNVPWKLFEKIMPHADLFLYDVKCITEELHINGTGVSNKLILENLERLSESNCEITVRIPVIGGFNDSDEEMEKTAEFLKRLGIKKAELLPYHNLGDHKYKAIGREPKTFSVPDEEKMKKFRSMFTGL